jgi:hypothetical protein
MIISKTIKIKPSNKNRNYYKSKGYDCTKVIDVEIKDLPSFSHYKIKVKCDICGKEKDLVYFKYFKNTKQNTTYYACSQKCATNKLLDTFNKNYGCISSQHPMVKEKQAQTNIKLYGGKSPQCDKSVKEKSYKTMIEKYGFPFPHQNDIIKNKFISNIKVTVEKANNTKIKRCLMVEQKDIDSYKLYRRYVDRLTRYYKKELYQKWDGNDYYDNESIQENLKLSYTNKLYPSIDHKISILYGFLNNINPKFIGGIDNLCITKRVNNSKKNSKNYYNFCK